MPHLRTTSGITWHFDDEGERHAEPLLFIHGWGVDRRIWRQQLKYFSDFYRVVAVDLPGHGKSEFKKISLERIARDLMEVLAHLQLAKVNVVGSSLGGMVAMKLYDLYPQVFKRIVFVGAMPKFSRSDDFPHGLDVQKMKKLGGQVSTDYPSIVNIFFRSLFTKQERQTRRFKWLQKFRQFDETPLKQALIDYLEILEHEDMREVLKNINVPVQFINGREDEICRAETVIFLQQSIPHSQVAFFDECGHFPFLSKSYEFNETLEQFLKKATL